MKWTDDQEGRSIGGRLLVAFLAPVLAAVILAALVTAVVELLR